MIIESYPLQWPQQHPRTPPEKRKRARFSKQVRHTSSFSGNTYTSQGQLTVAEACKRVLQEIRAMTVTGRSWRADPADVVISTNIRTRQDGLPYSNALAPEDPGAAVYFVLDGEDYCLPCDKWDRVADNIAAIAAHIGALRGIERWGVGDLRQAFTGWKALPDPESVSAPSWRTVLGIESDCNDLNHVRDAYRRLRRRHHPDTPGVVPNWENFHIIQCAWEQAQRELK